MRKVGEKRCEKCVGTGFNLCAVRLQFVCRSLSSPATFSPQCFRPATRPEISRSTSLKPSPKPRARSMPRPGPHALGLLSGSGWLAGSSPGSGWLSDRRPDFARLSCGRPMPRARAGAEGLVCMARALDWRKRQYGTWDLFVFITVPLDPIERCVQPF